MNWLTEIIFAHRGLHNAQKNIIENSASAFDLAIQKQCGFELDTLLSKDGIAMVFHDLSLERLTEESGRTIHRTALELTRMNLGNSQDKIATLKQILNKTQGQVPILIEIKGDQNEFIAVAEAVWHDIKDYSGNLAIMSFYPEILKHFKINHPSVICGLVATTIDDGDLRQEYFIEENQIETIKRLNIDFIAYDINALPNNTTEYCKSNNIPVLTWTVRSAEDNEKAKKFADNIIFEH